MLDYTPKRAIHRSNMTGTPYDRHIKLEFSNDNKRLEITLAVGPIPDTGEKNKVTTTADDGAVLDVSLMDKKYAIYPKMIIDIDEWQARADWKERCHWYLQTVGDNFGSPLGLVNRTADQASRRLHANHYFNNGFTYPLHLFVPFKDSDFSEISLRAVLITDQSQLFSNRKFEAPAKGKSIDFVVPTLKVVGPKTIKANESTSLHVSHVINNEPTGRASLVDLHAQNGYLPKTRLLLQEGEADFKVMALGLDPGDVIKIKAGFFFFPSAVEHILTVV